MSGSTFIRPAAGREHAHVLRVDVVRERLAVGQPGRLRRHRRLGGLHDGDGVAAVGMLRQERERAPVRRVALVHEALAVGEMSGQPSAYAAGTSGDGRRACVTVSMSSARIGVPQTNRMVRPSGSSRVQ